MSAIGGFAHLDGEAADACRLDAMAKELAKGGPDRQASSLIGSCGLFHNLLRITPEDAFEKQPLAVGDLTLVADLRIDNRDDLIRSLGISDRAARDLPDSRLTLLAFEKWGKACVAKMIGEFAFAIWNQREGELFLARDQRGYRPLFYTRQGNLFAFASLPTALFRLSEVPRKLNEEKMAAFLTLSHRDHESTHFVGIHRLAPGHTLTIGRGKHVEQCYWKLNPERRIILNSDDAYVEQAREILGRCVRSTLRSATPIGAFMSGGLDSSTVACVAARELEKSGQRLATFTEAPPLDYPHQGTAPKYFDESPFIEAIARAVPNIETNFVRPEYLELLAPDDTRHENLCSPARNPFNHLWLEEISRRAEQRGIRVLLGGQSGNMSLSYDGLSNLARWAKQGRFVRLANALAEIPKQSHNTLSGLLKAKVIAPSIPMWLRRSLDRLRARGIPAWHTYSALRPEFARRQDIAHIFDNGSCHAAADSRQTRVSILSGYDYIGELSQSYARSTSTEIRDPLGDIRLIEFCLAIPEEQYLRSGQTRWLIKRVMAGMLPEVVLKNQSKGVQLANWHHHASTARARIQAEIQYSRNSDFAARVLDLDRMQGLMDPWPDSGWHEPRRTIDYRLLLARGAESASFIRWFETTY